jgi:hypothetical protein
MVVVQVVVVVLVAELIQVLEVELLIKVLMDWSRFSKLWCWRRRRC